MTTGKNLISGEWVDGETREPSFSPATNSPTDNTFAQASTADVDAAALASTEASAAYGGTSATERAQFLRTAADCIEARGDEITAVGGEETALPRPRLEMERGRTANQLRLFAECIEGPEWLDWRHVAAMPDRQPVPRPDLLLRQVSLGPVAVFGAANFPLAFSVAGGDTAAALAAGCPVIAKAHPCHPGTCEVMATALLDAIRQCGMPTGTFACLHGSHATAQHLVRHPAIAAVGFTGSRQTGRLLADMAASRPKPIPFFAEMSSINPVFVLPNKLATAASDIGSEWAGALTLGAGQFCTNPGVLAGIAGADFDNLLAAAGTALANAAKHTMLAPGIAKAYRRGISELASTAEMVSGVAPQDGEDCVADAAILRVSGEHWLAHPELADEVFGPVGLAVSCADESQLLEVAAGLEGQLTATMHLTAADEGLAHRLLPILERKAGRLICNGFPTGVEVCAAMMHGGPYPASSSPSHTSVGTMAIRRFLRPICYQNFPESLAPKAP